MLADHFINHPAEVWRFLLLSVGFFNIGFAMFVATMYLKGRFHSGVYNYGRHVFAIMVSYIILTVTMMYEIGIHAGEEFQEPATWRLPVATVAFVLGTYALHALVTIRAKLPKV